MVLKRGKVGLNTGNSFGRRRFNYLNRTGAASWGFVTTAARVSSLKHLQSIDAAVSDLTERLKVANVGDWQSAAARGVKLDDGTTCVENVAYSLNKKNRWQSVEKFAKANDDSVSDMKKEDCALSFMVMERTYVDAQRSSARNTKAKIRCVASNNLDVQPFEKKKGQAKSYLWFGRMCPNCGTLIEKDEGCRRMVCAACLFEFCWDCMKPIDNNHVYSDCAEAQHEPIVLKEVRPRCSIETVFGEVTGLNLAHDYRSFSRRKSCEASLSNRYRSSAPRRLTRIRSHHNQHFRGVQRPQKVKSEVEAYKDARKPMPQTAADCPYVPENNEFAFDDEIVAKKALGQKQAAKEITPHLVYAIDIARAPSAFAFSSLAKPGVKTSSHRVRSPIIASSQIAEAKILAKQADSAADDELDQYALELHHEFEPTDEIECAHLESKNDLSAIDEQEGIKKTNEKKVFNLMDFVRVPRANRHAGRPSSTKTQNSSSSSRCSSDSQFSVMSFDECDKCPQQSGRSSPIDESYIMF